MPFLRANYIMRRMPDLETLKGHGQTARRLEASFSCLTKDIPFSRLSDGEKIYILQAMLMTIAQRKRDMFVFWDEPDNYVALAEAQSFIRELRAAFAEKGQIIIASHNRAASQAFTRDSTMALYRENHEQSPQLFQVPEDVDYLDFIEYPMPEMLSNEPVCALS